MDISDKYVYLLALIPFCLIWLFLYAKRKDLRKEMIFASIFVGILSVLTSYFWWTRDWWRPLTITGTVVGVEDFIMGFTSGGIMSVIYNFLLSKTYSKPKVKINFLSVIFLLILMACLTFYLFLIVGFTSFWSCVVTSVFTIISIDYFRRDLIIDSLISGVSMLIISTSFYLTVLSLSSTWVDATYLQGLSGLRLWTIPIEEFVFWFLAGMWVGPFYEYSFGKKLKNL